MNMQKLLVSVAATVVLLLGLAAGLATAGRTGAQAPDGGAASVASPAAHGPGHGIHLPGATD